MNSILIPVFNNSKLTKNILTQIKDFNGEIIVCDDGSTDETQEVLKQFSNIKVITNKTNLGFAKTCNNLYKESTGDKICFLNNDVKFTGRSIKELSNLFDLVKDNTLAGPTGGFVNPKTFNFEYHTDAINKKINYICGWCVVGTKITFDKFFVNSVGPFVEDFTTYFEDAFMGWQSLKLGVKFRIIRAPFSHIGRATSSTIDFKSLYTNAKAKFIEKVNNEFSEDELKRLTKRSGFE